MFYFSCFKGSTLLVMDCIPVSSNDSIVAQAQINIYMHWWVGDIFDLIDVYMALWSWVWIECFIFDHKVK